MSLQAPSDPAVPPNEGTLTLQTSRAAPPLGEAPAYLTIIEDACSSHVPLPPAGEVTIGRAPECTVVLPDRSASRLHARIAARGEDLHVEDLGSHNGTTLNGEPLGSARALRSGDVIGIGTTSLVFHRDVRPSVSRAFLDGAALQARLEEEVDRSLRHQRPLAVAVAHLGPGIADRPRVARALDRLLRPFDGVGFVGPGELVLVLPELAPDLVEPRALAIGEALKGLSSEVRACVVSCPDDGADADALLGAARAGAAQPRASGAAGTSSLLDVGGQQVVVCDPVMIRLYELLRRLAASDLSVLVQGPTGAGKELAATALHAWSRRSGGRLVTLNCAAIPEHLVESELFGHERGAFSGATAAKPGLFETAHGGTLFLDEVGELNLTVQAKLLRVLETKRFTRVGDVREREADVRLVAATHRKLEDEVRQGRFREDLLFRLRAARVVLPALRDRRQELPVLARTLLSRACEAVRRPALRLSPGAMQALLSHPWPGNVRELKNAMDYVAATASEAEELVEAWHLPEEISPVKVDQPAAAPVPAGEGGPGTFRPIDEEIRDLERRRMLAALKAAGGVQKEAAKLISMPLRTFATRMKQLGLTVKPPVSTPRTDA